MEQKTQHLSGFVVDNLCKLELQMGKGSFGTVYSAKNI
jgi:hypothetical protein